MDIVKAKIEQATRLLDEMNIDAWALFERETAMQKDPTHDMVVGLEAVWNSLFLFTRRGDAIALVGNFDADLYRRSGRFTQVHSYVKGAGEDIKRLLREVDPATLALNYSVDDCASDGLTHGMFLMLQSFLAETPYAGRIVSSQPFIGKLRSRKLPEEIARLERAAHLANQVWSNVSDRVRVSMTEREIAALIDSEVQQTGGEPSFETIVNAGAKTNPGHGHPTDTKLEPGDLLHVDFGVRIDDYCSDIQRLAYFRRPGEAQPPDALNKAFETVKSIIIETGKSARPGVKGFEVDALARRMLAANGYSEYEHALGHQLGRDVHDGGGLLGPQWERYGNTPFIPIELGNVFTLELEILLPGIGTVGLEEDVVVEGDKTRFLCEPQVELAIR
ncbi:aminopeptidase P family protein [candidate division GN15 bacterium]|uniref:Aminopeptidase P family protein n=1 Tax=candidate division GN15 bacterium TaxID=2072418 RepID=A0A855X4P0_9BACT|nr:MAG: aminopeptidase P family protein [candidate division GN15 bacterium]